MSHSEGQRSTVPPGRSKHPESSLHNTQGQFLKALQEPILAESRSRTMLPNREGEVSAHFIETAQELISPSAALLPVERLELYHRQYWYRLLDAIGEDFEVLHKVLGDDLFWGLLESYLLAQPPSTYNLRHLGEGLASFIANNKTIRIGHIEMSLPQSTLAADLARIEYAVCLAFERAEHPQVSAKQLAQQNLSLQPHLSLIALHSSADTLWRRHDAGHSLGQWSEPGPHFHRYVAVFRMHNALLVERLPQAAFKILRAIDSQGTLDAAIAQVLAEGGLKRRRDRQKISAWFSLWMARGWICHGPENPSIQ